MTARARFIVLLLGGCSSAPGELTTPELGLTVTDERGLRAPVACEALPVLLGGRRHTELVIDGKFTITVVSSPSEARVRFTEGVRPLEPERVIPREALETEFNETVPLLLQAGGRYTAVLSSECAP